MLVQLHSTTIGYLSTIIDEWGVCIVLMSKTIDRTNQNMRLTVCRICQVCSLIKTNVSNNFGIRKA